MIRRNYPCFTEDVYLAQLYGATDMEVYYDDLDYGSSNWASQVALADWASKTDVSDQSTLIDDNGPPQCPGLN